MSNQEPEPWEVEYDDLTEEWVVHWPDGYAVINGLMNGHQAQLIAAAPEMLEALRAMLAASLPVDKHANGMDAVEKAISAINKARGKTE